MVTGGSSASTSEPRRLQLKLTPLYLMDKAPSRPKLALWYSIYHRAFIYHLLCIVVTGKYHWNSLHWIWMEASLSFLWHLTLWYFKNNMSKIAKVLSDPLPVQRQCDWEQNETDDSGELISKWRWKNLCLVFLIVNSPVIHPSSQRLTSPSLFWLHKNKGEENVKLPERSSLGLKKEK